jgi:hypothetical protein
MSLTSPRLVDVHQASSDLVSLSLKQIVSEYKITGLKLHAISDIIPINAEEDIKLTRHETSLMDQQANFLEAAINTKIETIDDAKAILELWRYEVVESQSPDSLSTSDALIISVCRHFEI